MQQELLYKYFQQKASVSDVDFDHIQSYFRNEKFKRNAFLLSEGEVCSKFYFVTRGCIRFFTLNEEGKELTRYFAFEGKFGTALTSFINGKSSFEFIQALEPTEVLTINREDFYHLVRTSPEVNRIYLDILEMAYSTSQERIYGLQGASALERLQWLMDYQPDILLRLSSKVIASYLGVTRYTLSRLKAEL